MAQGDPLANGRGVVGRRGGAFVRNGARGGARELSEAAVKLGFVGPAHGDLVRLRALCERLLFEVKVDRVYHLGSDDSLDRAMVGWAERLGAPRDDEALLDEVALLAPDAPAEVLEALLAREAVRARLSDVTDLTAASGCRVEMADDRLVLVAHDRARPDDDDLANALVVVQGSHPRPDLQVANGRVILMPGDVSRGGHMGLIERVGDRLRVAVLDGRGRTAREASVPLRGAPHLEVRA
jgi:hypothetical protein